MILSSLNLPGRFGGDPNVWRKFADAAGDFAVNLCIAGVVLVLTVWASRWASNLVRRALGRLPRTRGDATLQGFGASLVRWAVLIVGLIAVLTRLGVETTSVIAVLGAASLAVGLALQGTLGNVAAGVMLLVFRPYRVGDFVEVAGKQGTVRSLDLFTTELDTPDNVRLTAPNGKVFGDFVFNYSAHATRRVDVTVTVPARDDLRRVLDVLRRTAAAEPRALSDPAPVVEALAVTDVVSQAALRVWVAREDHAAVKSDLTLAAKQALAAEGLSGAPAPTPA